MKSKGQENQRRTPKQARSKFTCDAILTAAAQILDADGEAALTTNAIATRAGVSIGTLYQYFSNKEEVLLALAAREGYRPLTEQEIRIETNGSFESVVRLSIRRYLGLAQNHQRARRTLLAAVMKHRDRKDMGREIDAFSQGFDAPRNLSDAEKFVVTRAVVGVVQSAVWEGRTDLRSPEFEDALVSLVCGYCRPDR